MEGIITNSPFYSAYTRDFTQVNKFYEYNPGDLSSFQGRKAWLERGYRQSRKVLVQQLLEYNHQLGCSGDTAENIALLGLEGTLAVVTGQQAGVATGPLYTIYKAITTIQLAEKLRVKLGVPVVPVFWVASEDHDYQEINHIFAMKGIGSFSKIAELWGKGEPLPERLSLAGYPQGSPPIGEIPVGKQVFDFITRMENYLPATVHKAAMLQLLGDTARASTNLGEWFARLMTAFLGSYGLIIVDPLLPGLRQLLSPFFQRAIGQRRAIKQALNKKGKELQAMGYPVPFGTEDGITGLFTILKGQRLPLIYREGKFTIREELQWEEQELIQLAAKTPEQLSCSAYLRPIAQDCLLPTVAYVGGPGEVAYFAQLKDIYPLFNQQMPVVFPRQGFTLIEPKVGEIMERLGIELGEVYQKLPQVLNKVLEAQEEQHLNGIFAQAREGITKAHQGLMEKLTADIPVLQPMGPLNQSRIMYQLEYLEKKTYQHLRKKHRALVNELHFVAQALFPKGKLQERTYNIVQFYASYGNSLLEQLLAEDLDFSFRHQVVFLGEQEAYKDGKGE
jgi:bacillithiol biosynthesis cysteine-adding enzyme BshC